MPHLAAWPLSGKSANQEAFQRELLVYSQHPGGVRPPQVMKASSNAGIAGIRNGIEVVAYMAITCMCVCTLTYDVIVIKIILESPYGVTNCC